MKKKKSKIITWLPLYLSGLVGEVSFGAPPLIPPVPPLIPPPPPGSGDSGVINSKSPKFINDQILARQRTINSKDKANAKDTAAKILGNVTTYDDQSLNGVASKLRFVLFADFEYLFSQDEGDNSVRTKVEKKNVGLQSDGTYLCRKSHKAYGLFRYLCKDEEDFKDVTITTDYGIRQEIKAGIKEQKKLEGRKAAYEEEKRKFSEEVMEVSVQNEESLSDADKEALGLRKMGIITKQRELLEHEEKLREDGLSLEVALNELKDEKDRRQYEYENIIINNRILAIKDAVTADFTKRGCSHEAEQFLLNVFDMLNLCFTTESKDDKNPSRKAQEELPNFFRMKREAKGKGGSSKQSDAATSGLDSNRLQRWKIYEANNGSYYYFNESGECLREEVKKNFKPFIVKDPIFEVLYFRQVGPESSKNMQIAMIENEWEKRNKGKLANALSNPQQPAAFNPVSPQQPAVVNIPVSPQQPAAFNPVSPQRPAVVNPVSPQRPAVVNQPARRQSNLFAIAAKVTQSGKGSANRLKQLCSDPFVTLSRFKLLHPNEPLELQRIKEMNIEEEWAQGLERDGNLRQRAKEEVVTMVLDLYPKLGKNEVNKISRIIYQKLIGRRANPVPNRHSNQKIGEKASPRPSRHSNQKIRKKVNPGPNRHSNQNVHQGFENGQ